ncbi:MAG: hypothetical protein ABIP97_10915 [Chthoniobacterales bacterium]
MTSTGRLLILLVVVLTCFFVPGQVGKISPHLFEREIVHTVFATMAAFLGSLGLFLSLRRIINARTTTRAIWPFLGFLLFFGLTFSLYVMQLKESYTHREEASDLLSSKGLPLSLHKLSSQATPAERQAIAMGIFRVYGVSVLYETQKGQFSFYRPVKDDIDEQANFRLIAQKSTQILAAFNYEIAELQHLILIYAASLFVVFGLGAVWVISQKERAMPDDLEPPDL